LFYKGGLTGAQGSMECEDGSVSQMLPERSGGMINIKKRKLKLHCQNWDLWDVWEIMEKDISISHKSQ
jgi:hypothetical protein